MIVADHYNDVHGVKALATAPVAVRRLTGQVTNPSCRATATASSASGTPTATRRATIRYHVAATPDPEAETIYYLRTSRPHVSDISISGPYHPLGMIVPQVLNNLRDSTDGLEMFLEAFPRTEGQDQIQHFDGITAPLDDEPEHKIMIDVISQHNPTVASKLPGLTYNLMVQTLKYTDAPEVLRYAKTVDGTPVKDVRLHGTFLARDEAEAAARKLLKDTLKRYPGGREVIIGWTSVATGELFMNAIVGMNPAHRRRPEVAVIVSSDSGFVSKG